MLQFRATSAILSRLATTDAAPVWPPNGRAQPESRRFAVLHQPLGQDIQILNAHEKNEGVLRFGETGPIGTDALLGCGSRSPVMTAKEGAA